MAAGTSQLNGAVVPVLDVVLEELPAVQDSARTISSDVAALTEAVSGASGSVSTDLASVAADLDQLQQDHPELADDPTWQRLVGTVGTASGRAEEAVAEERPAVEPDPLELLGLAPAPYDVDAT